MSKKEATPVETGRPEQNRTGAIIADGTTHIAETDDKPNDDNEPNKISVPRNNSGTSKTDNKRNAGPVADGKKN